MTISEMLQTPEKYIPYGDYCYHESTCPFWSKKKGEYPEQEDGYCHYLQKSDWDINEESKGDSMIIYSVDGTMTGKTIADLEDDEIDPISGKKIHFPMSLIWDQCKECSINMEDPDDIELYTYPPAGDEKEEHD